MLDCYPTFISRKWYDPSEKEPWWDVVNADNFLCLAPLIENYEHKFASIPSEMQSRSKSCFPNGVADPARHPGCGSKTFYVNDLALKFGCVDGLKMLE